ncbi:MAG: LD-carboxypeptidase [Terracidiphilus sp.]
MKSQGLLKPPAVVKGSGFSIIAPASSAKPERIDSGRNALRALGYLPEFGRNTLEREPLYFAGTPDQRLDDLHAAFADSDTSAIMALRGGYGSNYLLDDLAFDVISSNPKPFFAYSDLTGIQLRLLDELGLPVFHGPMLAADFYREDGVHLPSFNAALSGEPYSVGPDEGLRLLKRGSGPSVVGGTLYGGCLSIILTMLATPWEPCTEGALLFLEDLACKPYQVDRMLWQMRHARKLEGVAGIIFGEMLNCVSPGAPPDLLDDAILSALDGFKGPIAIGLRSGHVSRQNVTLTFGVEAELVTDGEPRLNILEPAVAP